MFDSNVTAKAVIDNIIAEDIIETTIPDAYYLMWLNSVEQMLCTEIIKEQAVDVPLDVSGDITMLNYGFDDIIHVYAKDSDNRYIELEKSTLSASYMLESDNIYFLRDGKLAVNQHLGPDTNVVVVYLSRPTIKTAVNYNTETIEIPYEFLPIIYAKIRGEKYKLANSDDLSAKWLTDYNALLETFTQWIAQRTAKYTN